MESNEIALIEKFSATDNELKALWILHKDYELQLEKLSSKGSLSAVEEMEVKELKKKKLAGKTKLIQLVEKYKAEA